MNIINQFISVCEKYPENTHLVDEFNKLTRRETLKRVYSLANFLNQSDFENSDKIGILLPNCNEFIISFFATALSRKIIVPLNCLLQPPELAYVIAHSNLDTIITSKLFDRLIEAIYQNCPSLKRIIYIDKEEENLLTFKKIFQTYSPEPVKVKGNLEDDFLLIYTSGTTGKPKGVMLTHKNLSANHLGCIDAFPDIDGRVCLGILPLFHSFGITVCILLSQLMNIKLVLINGFGSTKILKLIADEKISFLPMVPQLFAILLKSKELQNTDLSSLQYCVSGGGPCPKIYVEAWEKLTGKPLLNGYGLTEASPVVSVNRANNNKIGTIGIPFFNSKVEIWDDNGNPVVNGIVGEIMVKGNNVMKGYYKNEEETKKTISQDGWLHTGDMGFLDEEGFITITGRKKEIIISAGEKIYPQEIEDVLLSYPKIIEVAVIGIQDEIRGEVPKAFIVTHPEQTITKEEILEYCRQKLAPYKIPRDIEFRPSLPRNPTGKVAKIKLMEEEKKK